MTGRRLSARGLDRLRVGLSDRDLDVLQSLREYRLLQSHQLQRLHFADHASLASGARVCRRVLRRLSEQRLVVRLERRIGGARAGSAGHVYALSPLGARLLGQTTRKRHREPTAGFVAHTLAIAELGTSLTAAVWNSDLVGWQLQTEPQCWRTFHGAGHQMTLKPDLAVTLTDQDYELRWFVEIDLATESKTVIQRKCQTYTAYFRSDQEQAAHGLFPKVLWVVPHDERARQIETAIASAQRIEQRLFAIVTTEQALEVLLGEAEEA